MSSNTLSTSPFFTPTQIPGCRLWLDAADRNTITFSGSNITRWNDKSPSVTIAITSNGPAANPILLQNGGLYINNNSSQTYNASTYSMMAVQSNIMTTTDFTIAIVVNNPTNDTSALFSDPRAAGASETRSQLNHGFIFEVSTGGSGRTTSPTTAAGTGTRILIGTSIPAQSQFFNNGSLTGSNTTPITSYSTDAGGFPTLGGYLNTETGGTDNSWFTGTMFEVIFYTTALTTSQRQQLEGYLAWKWGLQPSLPANHPYKTTPFNIPVPPSILLPQRLSATSSVPGPRVPPIPIRQIGSRVFSPLFIPTCAMWFDAADTSTFTPANPSSGTSITGWRDKINNITLTNQNSSPTWSPNGVLFTNPSNSISGSTQNLIYVGSTPVSLSQNYTMFVAHAPNAFDALRVAFTVLAPSAFNVNPAFAAWVQPSVNEGNTIGVFDGSSSWRQLTQWNYVNTGTGNRRVDTLLASSTNVSRTNGIPSSSLATDIGSGSNISGTASLTGIGMSASSTFQGNRAYDGRIFEVLLYTSTLPLPAVQQIEAYLAWKWSFQGTLPNNSPYKKWPPPPN